MAGFISPARRQYTMKQVKRTRHRQVLVLMGGADPSSDCQTNTHCWYLNEPNVSHEQESAELRKFTELPDDCPKYGSAMCGVPGGFVVTGGRTESGDVVATCRMYVSATQSWVQQQDLPAPRFGHTALCFRGNLYVAGGKGGLTSNTDGVKGDVLGEIKMYCRDRKCKWHKLSFPEIADVPHVIGDYKNNLLWYYNDYKGTVYSFNRKTLKWRLRTSLPETRDKSGQLKCRGASVTCSEGVVYIAGGVCPVLAKYDISTDSLVIGTPPCYPHIAATLVHKENRLYLIGGSTKHAEEYDLETEHWETSTFKMPKKLYLMAATQMNVWGPKVVVQRWSYFESSDESGSASFIPPLHDLDRDARAP